MEKQQAIEVFSKLGERLKGFGSDDATSALIDRAVAANAWFSRSDIVTAVAAIRDRMLPADVLRKWLAGYDFPQANASVAVVTAGNIPLVGFLDIMCVVASGNRCFLKSSSKDSVLTEYVVGLLKEIEPDAPIYEYDQLAHYDAAIATGSDNTNRYFRTAFEGIPTLLRGSRYSAAVLSGRESTDELAGLAADMFLYNGMGCRNVSLVFLPRGCDTDSLGRIIAGNVMEVNPKFRRTYLNQRALMTIEGRDFMDFGSFVMAEVDDFPDSPGRINVCYYDDPSRVDVRLAELDERLQCVASNFYDHPRRTTIGQAQFPAPWEYPDGKDVMEFLRII